MRRTKQTTLFAISVLLACVPFRPHAQGITTEVLLHDAIFVADFDSVAATESSMSASGYRTTDVRVRVTRILRDANKLGLAPTVVTVAIKQAGPNTARLYPFWYNQDIQPSQTYIILSDGQRDLTGMIEQPATVELVTTRVDAVGDIELITNSARLSVFEQSRAVTEALRNPRQHSRFLAQHAAALLAADVDSGTMQLADTLDGSAAWSFSPNAREYFLHCLSLHFSRSTDVPVGLVRTFVHSAVRYLVTESAETQARATHLQRVILESYIPVMLKSERASAMLRQFAFAPGVSKDLRATAIKCASDTRLPAASRKSAQDLLALVQDKQ